MKIPSRAALLAATVFFGPALSSFAQAAPASVETANDRDALSRVAAAFAEGRPLASTGISPRLRDLLEQGRSVQQGRPANETPEHFAARISAVSERLRLSDAERARALELYRDRAKSTDVRVPARSEFRPTESRPEIGVRATKSLDAYARALGGLRADDAAAGAASAAAPAARTLGPAELRALNRIPGSQPPASLSHSQAAASPDLVPPPPFLLERGIDAIRRSEAIGDDGTMGTWFRRKTLGIGGASAIVAAKLSDKKTYSDWSRDLATVARGFTPSGGFRSFKDAPGFAAAGARGLIRSVARDFTGAWDQLKIYSRDPTPSQGLELASAFGAAGFNVVGLGTTGEAKTVVQAEAKAVVKDAVEDSLRAAAKDAARQSVKDAAREGAEIIVRNTGKAEVSAEKSIVQRLIENFADRNGTSPEAVRIALSRHLEERGFSIRSFESLPPGVQETQTLLQFDAPDFRSQLEKAGAFNKNLPRFSEDKRRAFTSVFERDRSYSKLMVVDGEVLARDRVRLYRHIRSDELSRVLEDRGLVPKGFKESSNDLTGVMNEAGGAEELVKRRVIDNPKAKEFLYEYTEHPDRAGLGPGVSSAGPIKIEILPRAGQKFIDTQLYSPELVGHNERGWATTSAISLDRIKIFGRACPSGCLLSSEEGQALARSILGR